MDSGTDPSSLRFRCSLVAVSNMSPRSCLSPLSVRCCLSLLLSVFWDFCVLVSTTPLELLRCTGASGLVRCFRSARSLVLSIQLLLRCCFLRLLQVARGVGARFFVVACFFFDSAALAYSVQHVPGWIFGWILDCSVKWIATPASPYYLAATDYRFS